MNIAVRNNVHVVGDGQVTLLMAHGFGCDQNMWRLMVPELARRYRIVLFDYVGCGQSDIGQYDPSRYDTLEGYATDLIEVTDACGRQPNVLVGHSVSAMIGVLADKRRPGLFDAHVMIGPSPSYIDEGDYVGGFSRPDVDELLATLEGNYLGWSSHMAPAIMGAPGKPELAEELTNSFCRTDPGIAARFARATFLSNNLQDIAALSTPALIVQSTDDFIAPVAVGEYLHRTMAGSALRIVENTGHCPHLSNPEACIAALDGFLAELGLEPALA